MAVCGFQGLKERIELQEKHAMQQREKFQEMEEVLEEKQKRRDTETIQTLSKLKQEHLRLSHNLLGVLGKSECSQANGIPLQTSEDSFRAQLEQIQKALNAPGQYKSVLNEIDAILSLQDNTSDAQDIPIQFDEETFESIQKFLRQQHEGIRHLVDIVERDQEHIQKLLAMNEEQNNNQRNV